jgi:uncharacterized protein YihD (DUF1040 family)
MRDPNRIEVVLSILREYWYKNSDLRLGQIVSNLADGDPYYIEDVEVIARLKQLQEPAHE